MNKPNTTLAAALLCGASALGGCATTNIGDNWQCPLTQGSPCLSVSGADPAAPGGTAGAAPPPISARSVGRSPAPRPEDNQSESNQTQPADNSGGESAACNAGCRPFAWLWRRGGESAAIDDAESDGEAAADGDAAPAHAPPGAPDDLRTPEVIGRIWIAPYVDANGVYREASWVRVVLEPARWRLP